MSKLSTDERTADIVEFNAHIENGEPEKNAGYWWVDLKGEKRVASWAKRIAFTGSKPHRWTWCFTNGEESDTATPFARIQLPDC